MSLLYHFTLCGKSRFIRLILGELRIPTELHEVLPWGSDVDLMSKNPAGTLPIFQESGHNNICGVWPIMEYLQETRGERLGNRGLFLEFPKDRAEVRRLVEWFTGKFVTDVLDLAVHEKITRRFDGSIRIKEPHMESLHAARHNLRAHMKYLSHLLGHRTWLAGDALSYADLAGASCLSVADYLDYIAWEDYPASKDWYVRIKSRPSFRPLLADRLMGVSPSNNYEDLDF